MAGQAKLRTEAVPIHWIQPFSVHYFHNGGVIAA